MRDGEMDWLLMLMEGKEEEEEEEEEERKNASLSSGSIVQKGQKPQVPVGDQLDEQPLG
jgi:hypothetical protein